MIGGATLGGSRSRDEEETKMRNVRWIRHLGVLLSLVTWIALVPGTPARATWPGSNGRIAFWDFMSGQIFAVNPDGTGLAQLTHVTDGQTAAVPRWSPDSTHIVFET